jgi:hypothetical protein
MMMFGQCGMNNKQIQTQRFQIQHIQVPVLLATELPFMVALGIVQLKVTYLLSHFSPTSLQLLPSISVVLLNRKDTITP